MTDKVCPDCGREVIQVDGVEKPVFGPCEHPRLKESMPREWAMQRAQRLIDTMSPVAKTEEWRGAIAAAIESAYTEGIVVSGDLY